MRALYSLGAAGSLPDDAVKVVMRGADKISWRITPYRAACALKHVAARTRSEDRRVDPSEGDAGVPHH